MKRAVISDLQLILIFAVVLAVSGCGGGGGGSRLSTSTISGVVGDGHYGFPVAGATVEVVSTTRAGVLQAVTDSNGAYSIADVPAGKVTLRVSTQDGRFRPTEVEMYLTAGTTLQLSPTLIESDMDVPTSISINPENVTVAVGEVTYVEVNEYPHGKPFMWIEGDVAQISSNGELIGTKPGVGVLVAQAGNVTARAKVTVGAGGLYGVVRGTVTDQTGRPVKDAYISMNGHNMAYTDSTGLFVIPGVSGGTYTVVVTAPGYEDLRETITVSPNQQTSVDWKLWQHVYENLRISPASITLGVGDTHDLVVTSDNYQYPHMKFNVVEPGGGTLDPSFVYGATTRYTAPNTCGTYHVVATSMTDPNQKVTATITVQAGSGTVIVE